MEEICVSKDIKALLKYLFVIFISVFLVYPLPHDSYSIIQYIIKPIRFDDSVLFLSGLLPLAILFIGVKGLFKLRWFANRSKILVTIIVLLLVIPLMRGSLEIVKSTFLSSLNEELVSIDLEDVKIEFEEITDNEAIVNVKLALIDYGKEKRKFNVRMQLPESLKVCFNTDFLDFEESYNSFGNNHKIIINKRMKAKLADGIEIEDVMDSHWYWETYYFDLYNGKNSSKLIYHGV